MLAEDLRSSCALKTAYYLKINALAFSNRIIISFLSLISLIKQMFM